MTPRRLFAVLLVTLLALVPAAVEAGEPFDRLETHVYFGLTTMDGDLVSQDDWGAFLDQEIAPRFPGGLTVIDAYGHSSAPVEGEQTGLTTKLLIIVHPATPENAERFIEIKAAFEARFGDARIFHTESPVRVVE